MPVKILEEAKRNVKILDIGFTGEPASPIYKDIGDTTVTADYETITFPRKTVKLYQPSQGTEVSTITSKETEFDIPESITHFASTKPIINPIVTKTLGILTKTGIDAVDLTVAGTSGFVQFISSTGVALTDIVAQAQERIIGKRSKMSWTESKQVASSFAESPIFYQPNSEVAGRILDTFGSGIQAGKDLILSGTIEALKILEESGQERPELSGTTKSLTEARTFLESPEGKNANDVILDIFMLLAPMVKGKVVPGLDKLGSEYMKIAEKVNDKLILDELGGIKRIPIEEVERSIEQGHQPFSDIGGSKYAMKQGKEPTILTYISDKGTSFKMNEFRSVTPSKTSSTLYTYTGKLGEVLDYDYSRTPELKNANIEVHIDTDIKIPRGEYNENTKTLVISAPNKFAAEKTAIHEIDHFQQGEGGLPRGGSTKEIFKFAKEEQTKGYPNLITVEKAANDKFYHAYDKLTGELIGYGSSEKFAYDMGRRKWDVLIEKAEKSKHPMDIPKFKQIYNLLAGEESSRRASKQWEMLKEGKITEEQLKNNPYIGSDIPDPKNLIYHEGELSEASRMSELSPTLKALQKSFDDFVQEKFNKRGDELTMEEMNQLYATPEFQQYKKVMSQQMLDEYKGIKPKKPTESERNVDKTIAKITGEEPKKIVKSEGEILGEKGRGVPISQELVEKIREEVQREIKVALLPETINQVKIDLEFGMTPPEISAKHGLSGDAVRVIGEKLYEERWKGQEGFVLNPVTIIKTIKERFKNWVKPQDVLDISTKEGLEAMQRHHRNIRDIEFSAMQLRKGFDKLKITEDRQTLITHALEQPDKYLKQLSPLEQNIYSYLKQARDEFSQLVKNSEILSEDKIRENYIFHWWIDPKSGQPYSTSFGRFSRNAPQLKERTYQTLEEGMASGQMPASMNPAELIQLSATSIVRAIQSRDMFKALNSIETGMGEMMRSTRSTEMKPLRLIENWSQLQDQGQTSNYIRYSHPTLDKPITYKDAKGNLHMLKGDIGVAKEIYPWVRDYFDNPTYGIASKLNFASKSMKLMSGFHVISLTMQGVAGGKGLGRLPIYNVIKGLKQIERSGDALGILYRNGLELKGYSDIGAHYDSGFKYLDKLGRVGTSAKAVLEGVQKFTFDVVHPGIKTNTALAVFDDMIKRKEVELGRVLVNGEKDIIGRETVNYVNRLFSGEDYKSAMLQSTQWMAKHFYSPEARKAWQSFLISPQWQKAHIGMVGDIIKSIGGDKNLVQSKYYRKYLYSAVAIYGSANFYNFIMTKHMDGTGRMMWENEGDNSFSVRAPWNNPNGTPVYVKPLKSIFEVPELLNMPITIKNGKLQVQFPINIGKIVSKLAPWITAIGKQAAYWKTYKEVDNPNAKRIWDFMVDIGAPMAITGVGQENKAATSKVLGVVGIPTSTVKKEKTPFQEMKAERRKERREKKKAGKTKSRGVRILD